jgi:hypothetical protein
MGPERNPIEGDIFYAKTEHFLSPTACQQESRDQRIHEWQHAGAIRQWLGFRGLGLAVDT